MIYWRRVVVVFLAIFLIVAATVSPAVHATSADPPYAATPGSSFNDPTGTPAQQYAIMDQIEKQIDNTKTGATIRMAFFSLNIPDFAQKLIDAHDRGVSVRLLMDDHAKGAQWESLVTHLGSDTGKESFAKLCHTSCLSPNDLSYQHAKYYMFSSSGSSKLVIDVSSANPTITQATMGWNNMYTMVGDSKQYDSYKQYFVDMTAGANGTHKPNYYRTTSDTDGEVKTYFMPRAGKSTDTSTDIFYEMLSNVSCSGTAKGYGASGHTVISVAMHQWTTGRLDLAKKLWSLDNAGCQVEVIYDGVVTDPGVLTALKKSGGKHGGVTLHNAAKDNDGDGSVDYYVHSKYMLIDGKYYGDSSSRLVFTGSQNFNLHALRYNDEVTIKINNAAAYAAFAQNYTALRTFAELPHSIATAHAGLLPNGVSASSPQAEDE